MPSVLHTPLMSGSNAIHGIVLVGALLVMGDAHGPVEMALGFVAVLLATANVVGGFVVTDRMLEMFQTKSPKGLPEPAKEPKTAEYAATGSSASGIEAAPK